MLIARDMLGAVDPLISTTAHIVPLGWMTLAVTDDLQHRLMLFLLHCSALLHRNLAIFLGCWGHLSRGGIAAGALGPDAKGHI